MSIMDDLAQEIWSAEAFHVDLARLRTARLIAELRQSSVLTSAADPDVASLTRLLQAALLFANSGQEPLRVVAQRISTAALRLLGDSVKDIFALIQARLRNFPAIAATSGANLGAPNAPLALQYEFVATRTQQTIKLGNDLEHVLTPFQIDMWRELGRRTSAAFTAPTSAGKSYVLLLNIVEQFNTGRLTNVAYVVPTRALINQVAEDAARELGRRNAEDVTVTTVPIYLGASSNAKALYVLTQERLDALLITTPNAHFDLIVIDEAQMLAEGPRGVLLEAVVDRLTDAASTAQFVFSGPMIENPQYFGELFGLKKFEHCSTKRSPVTQNIIFLDYQLRPSSQVVVRLDEQTTAVATIDIPISLRTQMDRLSYLSYLFGRSGSSVVYAGGKADAEKIAVKIANELHAVDDTDGAIEELISFVKKHVHKDYALAGVLRNGVGFHYGNMPSILRKELETHFKARNISFLVCTSTLLYGMNMPAKNIFMLKPTTGHGAGAAISGPGFWNLAGRAGRLGKELEGNVYLIDYATWGSRPVSASKDVHVRSALKATMVDQVESFLTFINDPDVSSERFPAQEVALGKLVLDERKGRLDRTIDRYRSATASAQELGRIRIRVGEISAGISLPTDVLNQNIGVSVFRQEDLLSYMVERLGSDPADELIPAHPLADFSVALGSYQSAFKRVHNYLLRYPKKDKRHIYFAPLALRWMRGDPLPVIIDGNIRYYGKTAPQKSVATIIRDAMEDIEDHLRFRYVKFFRCYTSILEVALRRTGHAADVANIPSVPLFLEMGASSGTMINLMALGLSRITAQGLAVYVTDKDMTADRLQAWIRTQDLEQLDLAPACIRELQAIARRATS
jgi:DEAD/DEAH box helicase